MKSIITVLSIIILNTAVSQSEYWKQTAGPYAGNVSHIAIDPNGRIFVVVQTSQGSGIGLYYSDDKGTSWTKSNIPYPPGYLDEPISVGIDSNGVIYICSYSAIQYKSTDRGVTWTPITRVNQIQYWFPISNNVVLAAATYGGLYRSTDGGISWTINTSLQGVVSILTSDENGTIYAGTQETISEPHQHYTSGFIYRSTDQGVTWSQVFYRVSYPVHSLAVRTPGNIIAGAAIFIFRSIGADTNWSSTIYVGSAETVNSLIIDSSGNVFAGTASSGVYLSKDTGYTWSPVGLSGQAVQVLALDKENCLYAGLNSEAGLYFSSDGGSSWIRRGMPITEIPALNLPAHNLLLQQNYPNPFNPKTTINFSIPTRGWASLRVFDLLGTETASLFNRTFEAGSYSVDWDASSFACGVYVYRIQTDNSSLAKTMLLLK